MSVLLNYTQDAVTVDAPKISPYSRVSCPALLGNMQRMKIRYNRRLEIRYHYA